MGPFDVRKTLLQRNPKACHESSGKTLAGCEYACGRRRWRVALAGVQAGERSTRMKPGASPCRWLHVMTEIPQPKPNRLSLRGLLATANGWDKSMIRRLAQGLRPAGASQGKYWRKIHRSSTSPTVPYSTPISLSVARYRSASSCICSAVLTFRSASSMRGIPPPGVGRLSRSHSAPPTLLSSPAILT